MIAHRLDTIKTAENILHLQDSKTVVSAEKGSEKYKEIMDEI
jgi:ABC-type multidrug transport system fused ATPase/permease subunit